MIGVGEDHRPDFAVSTPAASWRTERIRLTSAVSVISSDAPVRVFQDFAILDLLSVGSAAGRRWPARPSKRAVFGHGRFLVQFSVGTLPTPR